MMDGWMGGADDAAPMLVHMMLSYKTGNLSEETHDEYIFCL